MRRRKKKNSLAVNNEAIARGDIPKDYTEHLSDLRIRLFIALLFLVIGFAVSALFTKQLIEVLRHPLNLYAPSITLKYDYMGESIMIKLKVSLITSLIANIPLLIFLLWSYVKPAVDVKIRMFIRILLIAGIILFYCGTFFSYRFITPYTVKLIETFAYESVPNQINFTNYFNFLILMVTTLGLIFELPVIIAVLTKIGLITPKLLRDKRKYALLVIWIGAALITPPDILTQSMIAIPLMLLYEISVIIAMVLYRFSK